MTVFQMLFLLFLTLPLAEIYLFYQIGGLIGIGATIALVLLTAATGAALMRAQGLATLARVQETLASGGFPAVELLEGAFLLVAGALLITPGFLSDTVGFLCLIPELRRCLIRTAFTARFRQPGDVRHDSKSGTHIIEGEIVPDSERLDR